MGIISDWVKQQIGILGRDWQQALAERGWGLVLPAGAPSEIEQALEPLLAIRRAEAGTRFRVFSGDDGYQPGESAAEFLARHRAGESDESDARVPNQLLLAGDPSAIPFRVQLDLAVSRGIGRIAFASADEYARYARNVVRAATVAPAKAPQLTVVRTEHENDPVSAWGRLLPAMIERGLTSLGHAKSASGAGGAATKATFAEELAESPGPELTFVAAHGVEAPRDDDEQAALQGAFVCSEWTGPSAERAPLDRAAIFAAADADEASDLTGRIFAAAASFSAGTPREDTFALNALGQVRVLANRPFVAALPQKLLSLERGAAAWIGHADRIWCRSGEPADSSPLAIAYATFLMRMALGEPIGLAARLFGQRAAALTVRLEELTDDVTVRDAHAARELAEVWMDHHDLSSVVVLGDPAVRVPVVFRETLSR